MVQDVVEKADVELSYATAELTFVWLILLLCFGATYLLKKNPELSSVLPPSVVIIFIGALAGLSALPFLRTQSGLRFDPLTFYFAILPPILFSAGFNLKRRDFFRNFVPCFLYAVVGTALSAIAFGLGIYALLRLGAINSESIGHNQLIECLMFGSLIAATDPIATLGLMEHVQVPRLLFNFIFGESVLSDPISIELFSTFKRYSSSSETITIFDIVSSFTFITIMSILIGVGVAMVGAAILFRARLGSQDLGEGMNGSLFEVLVILGTSYMAYLISDVMHLSGIFSIFFAGVIHNHYSLYNIAPDSQKIIKGLVTLLSSIAETLMFAYLGLQVFTMKHVIDWGMILSAIPLCLLARAANIFPISFVVNAFRTRPVPYTVQIFQWFCGLRGALAYALALNMPLYERAESGRRRVLHRTNPAVETATLFIVIVTTVVFGIAASPLLRILGLEGKTDYDIGVKAPPQPNEPGTSPSARTRRGSVFHAEDRDDEDEDEDPPGLLPDLEGGAAGGPIRSRRAGIHGLWRDFDERYVKPLIGGKRRHVHPEGPHAALVSEMASSVGPSGRGSPEILGPLVRNGSRALAGAGHLALIRNGSGARDSASGTEHGPGSPVLTPRAVHVPFAAGKPRVK